MYSSDTSDAIKFMLPNLASISGVNDLVDLRSRPPKDYGYFGRGTLNPPSPD